MWLARAGRSSLPPPRRLAPARCGRSSPSFCQAVWQGCCSADWELEKEEVVEEEVQEGEEEELEELTLGEAEGLAERASGGLHRDDDEAAGGQRSLLAACRTRGWNPLGLLVVPNTILWRTKVALPAKASPVARTGGGAHLVPRKKNVQTPRGEVRGVTFIRHREGHNIVKVWLSTVDKAHVHFLWPLLPDREEREGLPHCGSGLQGSSGELEMPTALVRWVLPQGGDAVLEDVEVLLVGQLNYGLAVELGPESPDGVELTQIADGGPDLPL
eukprot:EG_transcript_7049